MRVSLVTRSTTFLTIPAREFATRSVSSRILLLLISLLKHRWNPDTASIKKKMTYTTSKDALKLSLNGIATEVQATSPEEIDYDTVLEKVSKGRA